LYFAVFGFDRSGLMDNNALRSMPRPLRIEFPGAVYHIMARGNQGNPVFADDQDRRRFLETLAETSEKTGWRVHAYVLMGNHYHLLAETPEPNLVAGMKWLQGTYTQRYNWRHQLHGYLFQGRYKAIPVQADNDGYLETVSTYIHLNPARAGLVQIGREPLRTYAWSSYPWYLAPANKGPEWLCRQRVLGSLHLKSPKGYEAYIESRALELGLKAGQRELEHKWKALRRGWYVGNDGFLDKLRVRLGRRLRPAKRDSHSGGANKEHGRLAAEQMLREALDALHLAEADLDEMRKGAPEKKVIAWWLRKRTTMSLAWISDRLRMGHPATVSHAVSQAKRGGNRGLERLKREVERLERPVQ